MKMADVKIEAVNIKYKDTGNQYLLDTPLIWSNKIDYKERSIVTENTRTPGTDTCLIPRLFWRYKNG